jgi:hypothetical protein
MGRCEFPKIMEGWDYVGHSGHRGGIGVESILDQCVDGSGGLIWIVVESFIVYVIPRRGSWSPYTSSHLLARWILASVSLGLVCVLLTLSIDLCVVGISLCGVFLGKEYIPLKIKPNFS